MLNVHEWWEAIRLEVERLATLAVPGEEKLLHLVTCDGHSKQMTTLGALHDRTLSWARRWNESDQNSGERSELIQELVVLFGLLVNARRGELWEAEPAIELREEK